MTLKNCDRRRRRKNGASIKFKPYNNAEGAELGAAFERKGSSLVGADAGELAGIGTLGIKVSDDLNTEKDNFDLLIDFYASRRHS